MPRRGNAQPPGEPPSRGAGRKTLVVHDLCGHPFQLELSRELARRGYDVLHLYSASFVTGKGDLCVPAELRDHLRIQAVDCGRRFSKYSFVRRLLTELRYSFLLLRSVRAATPDAVLSANDPLLTKAALATWARLSHTPWTLWQQDILSRAAENLLGDDPGAMARWVIRATRHIEAYAARSASRVVCISDDFVPAMIAMGVPASRCDVVPNWAPLDEIRPMPQVNTWSRSHGTAGRRTVLYAGTLGLKHNPELLVALGRALQGSPDAEVLVVSEGPGADHVRQRIREEALTNIRVLPFQPYESVPGMLGSAAVVVTLLEGKAGSMSVPSKVLSYLAAGQPIVGAVPAGNLAGKVIAESGAGLVVDPRDEAAFVGAVLRLLDEPETRSAMSTAARRYAEDHFDIGSIADRFERIVFGSSLQTELREVIA